MHQAQNYSNFRNGGRVSTPKLREALEHNGVTHTHNRYDLLLLVKKTAKYAGFTPRMIQLLDYYINYTRDIDWEEGGQPIVYQSLAKTALDLGVSERQIQKLERALFDIGAISWNDSGNHKRYGQRCKKTGEILFAYGIDLSPLSRLEPFLKDKLAEKQTYDRLWLETKRQISYYRSQIRACISEALEVQETKANHFCAKYEKIAVQIRTHNKLSDIQRLLEAHKELHRDILSTLSSETATSKTQKSSRKCVQKIAHNKYSKNKKSNELDSNNTVSISSNKSSNEAEAPEEQPTTEPETKEVDVLRSAGLQHITLKHAVSAASNRYKNYLPLEENDITWAEFIDAAYKLKNELGISQQSWGRGCEVLGRSGAALCVLVTDQATQRLFNPIDNPNAYLYTMTDRALCGKLKLHNSIFGILKTETHVN